MLFVSRVWLVAKIASSLLTHGSLPHGDVKRKMVLVEGLLLLDLFWSAIPVGLITFVELFFCTPAHLPVTAAVVWEKVKLAALVVDLVAAGHVYILSTSSLEHRFQHTSMAAMSINLCFLILPLYNHTKIFCSVMFWKACFL